MSRRHCEATLRLDLFFCFISRAPNTIVSSGTGRVDLVPMQSQAIRVTSHSSSIFLRGLGFGRPICGSKFAGHATTRYACVIEACLMLQGKTKIPVASMESARIDRRCQGECKKVGTKSTINL
jgi:hypothetical protein